ncbi:MAG: hypothetical protein AB7R89_33875 [Dehalococcoidia bacterium]
MLLLVMAADRAVAAQSSSVGVRYEGRVQIGTRPAPAGTPVIVIAPRSASDFTVCGRAAVDNDGRYQLDVPAMPDCIARTAAERRTLHIFVIHGENTGFQSNGASLDEPRSLGRTARQDLRGTDIIDFDPALAPADGTMPGVRYYGRLLLGQSPAPAGTSISVRVARGSTAATDCGQSTITDSNGFYWLDVPATPDCIARTADERPTPHTFVVDSARVGSESNGASLDEPRSLGETRRHDLRGAAPPSDRCTEAAASWWLSAEPTKAQQPPCSTELPVRVRVEGSDGFKATVADCFAQLRRIENQRDAAPIKELLDLLDSPPGDNGQRVTIKEDLTLALSFEAGTTVSLSAIDEPASALMRINPTVQLDVLVGDVARFFGVSLPTPPSLCALIVHELSHAADFMTGATEGGTCMVSDGVLKKAEIKAMAIENSYLLATGRELVPYLLVEDVPLPRPVMLPESAVHPTPESWRQYQRGDICP